MCSLKWMVVVATIVFVWLYIKKSNKENYADQVLHAVGGSIAGPIFVRDNPEAEEEEKGTTALLS